QSGRGADGQWNARHIGDPEPADAAQGVLWAAQADPYDYDYAGNLYHYDFASDAIVPVTGFTTEFVRRFAIAPDGEHVVFELQQEIGSEESDLWIVRLDGSGLRLLVEGASAPAWSR
ncbi:MAG: hypothetical protein R6W77_04840, partial [Trueperaceae bacterium]